MTRRFFIEPPALDRDDVTLPPPLAQRVAKVLRLRTDDEITLFDGSGEETHLRLDTVAERHTAGHVIERFEGAPEPSLRLHLYQSITKGERFEWLVEKGTEIGVARFVPLLAARAIVKTGEGSRLERWRRIAVEAAEQCGRTKVPAVDAPLRFAEALAEARGLVLLPYEAAGDTAPGIIEALAREIDALFALGEVSVLIGPEGGFEEAEVEAAREAGGTIVTMGNRVLRSETAGLVAAALVMQAGGEMG